jgi:uncharacterized protein (TIGR03790 family)
LRLLSLLLFSSGVACVALEPAQVVILVNKDTPDSSRVAHMYQARRGIPSENVLKLSLGDNRNITPEQYWSRAGRPVREYLHKYPAIRCIVTTAGVPYTVLATGDDPGAAFDNELAAVLREEPNSRQRGQANPLFLNGMNPYGVTDPRILNMVYVARLDGPDLKTIARMVDDAIATEKGGLEGPVAGDAQGIDGITGYGIGDASIRAAVDRLSAAGFPATLDMKQESWTQPKDAVGNQAAGAAFYVGWYNLLDFQDIFGNQGLARGAIAWHIASQEAQDIWNLKGRGWCINLIRRGAAVTLGPVREPYVAAFPHGDVFVEVLLRGGSIAESYWLALPHVSWAMVLLGDPLYRPFGVKPRPAVLARAYVSTNSSGVLEKGAVSSLLVQLECVGPPGSGTPALTATAEPEMGVAEASGRVEIPALLAGQSTVVRIPKVKADNNPSALFRLRLNVQSPGEASRRIVVEGRIGFARLTGTLGPKSQMFISPDGRSLISGQVRNSIIVDTKTLETRNITPSEGMGITAAEFSPDASHIFISLVSVKEKKVATVIADRSLQNIRQLPSGTQFVRWLSKDTILLRASNVIKVYNVNGGEERTFEMPDGWTGTILPGSMVEVLVSREGKMAIQSGSGPARGVLQSVSSIRSAAVADDLSILAGLDSEKRVWVQHGVDGQPVLIASGVEGVVWGPHSRRAVIQQSGKKTCVYDLRGGSRVDLGVASEFQWSSDDEKLLFVEGEAGGTLSLLSGSQIQHLCPMTRIGQIAKVAFSADSGKVFLLAAISGKTDVWVIDPPKQ